MPDFFGGMSFREGKIVLGKGMGYSYGDAEGRC